MNKYDYFLKTMREKLPLEECFDLVEHPVNIGGRSASLFFIDGLVRGHIMQQIMTDLLSVTESQIDKSQTADDFISNSITLLDSVSEDDVNAVIKYLYSGLVPLVVDGFNKVIIMDVREYPSRAVNEPQKEKSLRGAKDGFTETFMSNIALVRRRIRDNRLIVRNYTIGSVSKTDVCIVYMKGLADEKIVKKVDKAIRDIKVDTLTVGEQSLVEAMGKKSPLNPFPKVRYTQRPDVVSAHITEGKIAIITDNTPTVILIPVGIFDFVQDVDDYYFPAITGSYFRALRLINFLVILFLTPVYLMLTEEYIDAPDIIKFFIPDEDYAIPIFWQFILIEAAIDGLKLASLNTPESLGMSLSVIGALLLGEVSIESGWFIPQTIFCMAVVALAAFTQPSIELSFAVKFARILLLTGVFVFGYLGGIIALLIIIAVIAFTRTLSGTSYLYPLVPFKWQALKKLLFRTMKKENSR